MLKVVLDTNVIISALHRADSDPDLIVSLVLTKDVRIISLCLSAAILEEYQEVLSRAKFSYFSRERVAKLLRRLREAAVWVEPKIPVDIVKVDPADNKFLECALACEADFLITGNVKHFPFKKFHDTIIVNPKKFIELIANMI